MEQLHPVAQVVTILVIGVCFVVIVLALYTDYFNNKK